MVQTSTILALGTKEEKIGYLKILKYSYVCILFFILRDKRMNLQGNVHYCEEVLDTVSCFSAVGEMDVSLVSWFYLPW